MTMTKAKSLSDGSHSLMAVGAPSIIMIFVILCLTCFAALSMVSANADMRLATRAGDNTAAWYEADAQAQRALQKLDALLGEGVTDAAALEAEGFELIEENGEKSVRFYTAIGEYTAIKTRVSIEGGGVGQILESCTVVTQELEYTQIPFVWDGVIVDD